MRSIQIGLMILFLNLVGFQGVAVARGGDLIGNGGSFTDLRFIEIAYEFLEAAKRAKGAQMQQGLPQIDVAKLEELLTRVNIEQSNSSLDLGVNEKHGINFPHELLIQYDRVTFENQSKAHQDIFVVHELLPLLGISDSLFRISRPLVEFLKASEFWTTEYRSPKKVHYEEILESYHDDDRRFGFQLSVAIDLCQKAKKIYVLEYYFVYCEFIEKKQGYVVPYVVDFSRGVPKPRPEEEKGRPVSRDVLERDLRKEHPIFRPTSSYGLNVYGLGRTDELTWRVIMSTRAGVSALLQANYGSRLEALRNCRQFLSGSSSNDIRYHSAVCRTGKETNLSTGTRFYFEVLSQNPLLAE